MLRGSVNCVNPADGDSHRQISGNHHGASSQWGVGAAAQPSRRTADGKRGQREGSSRYRQDQKIRYFNVVTSYSGFCYRGDDWRVGLLGLLPGFGQSSCLRPGQWRGKVSVGGSVIISVMKTIAAVRYRGRIAETARVAARERPSRQFLCRQSFAVQTTGPTSHRRLVGAPAH